MLDGSLGIVPVIRNREDIENAIEGLENAINCNIERNSKEVSREIKGKFHEIPRFSFHEG